jgi:MFS family permease
VIYAKLSDIFGTKLLILCAVTLFATFSIACGVSINMLQLYVGNSSLPLSLNLLTSSGPSSAQSKASADPASTLWSP